MTLPKPGGKLTSLPLTVQHEVLPDGGISITATSEVFTANFAAEPEHRILVAGGFSITGPRRVTYVLATVWRTDFTGRRFETPKPRIDTP